MCRKYIEDQETQFVQLMHCPEHNRFHLCLGKASLQLTPREVLLLGATIDRWWKNHPDQLKEVRPFVMLPDPE